MKNENMNLIGQKINIEIHDRSITAKSLIKKEKVS